MVKLESGEGHGLVEPDRGLVGEPGENVGLVRLAHLGEELDDKFTPVLNCPRHANHRPPLPEARLVLIEGDERSEMRGKGNSSRGKDAAGVWW